MAICAFQFSIPQLMILIVESFHVKDGTLRKMLGKVTIILGKATRILGKVTIIWGKVVKNIMLSHIPYPLESGIDIGTDSNFETGAYWIPSKSQKPTVLGQGGPSSTQYPRKNTRGFVYCVEMEGSCWCQTDGANVMPS